MPEMTKHEPGMFNWVDLMATDAENAKYFYTQLLGCETQDNPVGDGSVYTMLLKNGKRVAGSSKRPPA